MSKWAKVYISVWSGKSDSGDQDEFKWVVGIKGNNVELVPLFNKFFNKKVTDNSWIKFSDFGMYSSSSFIFIYLQ